MNEIQTRLYEQCIAYGKRDLTPDEFKSAFPYEDDNLTNEIQKFLIETGLHPSGRKLTFISPRTFEISN